MVVRHSQATKLNHIWLMRQNKRAEVALVSLFSTVISLPPIREDQREVIGGVCVITSRWQEERLLLFSAAHLHDDVAVDSGWVFKKWFTLLNVWPTFPRRSRDGAINDNRCLKRECECLCSVQHSSRCCTDCLDIHCTPPKKNHTHAHTALLFQRLLTIEVHLDHVTCPDRTRELYKPAVSHVHQLTDSWRPCPHAPTTSFFSLSFSLASYQEYLQCKCILQACRWC